MSINLKNLFKSSDSEVVNTSAENQAALAELALKNINDGVIIINQAGQVKFINPAAVTMTGGSSPKDALGLNYLSVIKLETVNGENVEDSAHPINGSLQKSEPLSTHDYILVTMQGKKTPISLTCTPAAGSSNDAIITFRDITKELEEEGEQTEFISTASHEMRTPVASIEGYLGLALNPQTATIDARARQYLEAAHASSQHLGQLFRDLLDVTKLDDKHMKVHLTPTELSDLVKSIADAQIPSMQQKRISYTFGGGNSDGEITNGNLRIDPLIYAMVDTNFLREIVDNLVENAIKYTETGGSIWVNVTADGDDVLINVTDTGMGIAPDDIPHIFQKFYRADNSQTRTIGGTGLGLYLVKQRVEAMGGRVWAESSFGEGSTFYVTFPRISAQEYEQQRLALANQQALEQFSAEPVNSLMGSTAQAAANLNSIQDSVQASPTTAPISNPSQQVQVQPTIQQNQAMVQQSQALATSQIQPVVQQSQPITPEQVQPTATTQPQVQEQPQSPPAPQSPTQPTM